MPNFMQTIQTIVNGIHTMTAALSLYEFLREQNEARANVSFFQRLCNMFIFYNLTDCLLLQVLESAFFNCF